MKNFLLILLGLLLGFAVAVYRITHPSEGSVTVQNGVWQANKKMNLGEDKLLTAQIALGATFALQPSEVIYMVVNKDADGKVLHSGEDYVIKGNKSQLKSRYWSITLYGEDHMLVANEADRFSYNMTNTDFDENGNFEIHISSDKKTPNWLPSGEEESFLLLLRMYHPHASVYENVEEIELPKIVKLENS